MSIQSYLLQIRLRPVNCQSKPLHPSSGQNTDPSISRISRHFPGFLVSWFRWKKTLQTRTTFNPLTCTTSQSLSDCLVHIQSDQRQTGIGSLNTCNLYSAVTRWWLLFMYFYIIPEIIKKYPVQCIVVDLPNSL